MRKAQHIPFRSGDDDLNYTNGPVRIVHASVGVTDDCAALLLNMKFNSIKASIRAKKDLEDTLHVVQNHSVTSNSLRHQLENSFNDSRSRIAQLLANAAHAVRDQYTEEAIALRIALKVVNEDLGKIDDALRKESNQRRDYHSVLQTRFTDFCKRQGLANDYLERAFINARLLPSQGQSSNSQRSRRSKSDEQGRLKRSLNVTDQKSENRRRQDPSRVATSTVAARNIASPPRISELHHSMFKQVHVGTVPPPRIPELHSSALKPSSIETVSQTAKITESSRTQHAHSPERHHHVCTVVRMASAQDFISHKKPIPPSSPPLHDSVANHATLSREYREARHRLTWAQREFDDRLDTRDKEEAKNRCMLQESCGEKGMPLKYLDLWWMQHISLLTRNLISAEAAYRTARIAAIEAGYSIDDSKATSIFESRSEGYSVSEEGSKIDSASEAIIQSWLRKLPVVYARPESSVGSEQREGGESDDDSITPCDSWSTVATPRNKSKIGMWREICTAAHKQPGGLV